MADGVIAEAGFWGNIATVIVVVINQVLKRGIKASASYAKAHTVEAEMVSTSLRVYACQLLNTAILMLILRSEFSIFHDLPGEHYPTVNAKWYAEVGAPLIQTMAIQFATPPGVQIFTILLKTVTARKGAQKATTQNQLNESQAPHNFEIAAGYGEVLLAASVTMIFGSGIPLLYHVATVGFFVRAKLERWIVLNITKKPPLYSQTLFDSFDEVFALLLLVHVAMATYFIASAGGETPTSSHIYVDDHVGPMGDKSMHAHTWPIFCVLLVTIFGIISKFLGKCGPCAERARRQAEENEVEEQIPSFVDAYKDGLIINEDDDYIMDAYEDLMDFEEAFKQAVDAAAGAKESPFDDEAFANRVRDAVDAVLGENWIKGADGTAKAQQRSQQAHADKVEGEVKQRAKERAALPFRPSSSRP